MNRVVIALALLAPVRAWAYSDPALFAEGVDKEATEQAWQDWLTKVMA